MTQGRNRKQQGNEKQSKRGRPVIRWIGYLVFAIAYICISTSLWIFHGPFPALKNYLIDSIDATRHGYLLRPLSLYTIPESVIKAHSLTNGLVSTTVPVAQITRRDYSNVKDGSIVHDTYQGQTFKADILLIRDPERVKVEATKYLNQHGETVQEMVKDTGAVAGINAGGFDDSSWRGTGAYPQGITMHDGKLVALTGSKTQPQPVIAFTQTGQMIAGAYSLPQLQNLGVTEAVTFGPVLIQDGKPVSTTNGYDRNPRTAIGQTADGTVILIVTDGRFATGPNDAGATYDDVKQLMLKYHAVIAANLDGGSSTTMIYHNQLLNKPVDILGERKVATSIIVMPESGGGVFG
ncbi:phosphodiester glycosidase family protein [Alicyclobacillus dauci]|uniref:Phosphodiester glycosidase family protein n=1 Tax=Alicyclobacillus dauci TaxID=1475485 RepID=A0ABY6Z2E7_9BACL|nr:phosphodiester glycosidase family protein [Alicyclobacillus dauci]WAH36501.1 phosphodiester glycosidase family protein [Alicyclobacillus dauci]